MEEAYFGSSKIISVNGKKLKIKTKPGLETDQKLRLKALGEKGINGGLSGDLFLIPIIQNHPVFQRDGNKLRQNQKIDIYTAILGGKLNVSTFSGPI